MKIVNSIICLIFFVFILDVSSGQDFRFPIYQHTSALGYTNTWLVPISTLRKLPGWNEQSEPPLPVGKAVSLAKAWMVSKGFSTQCYVGSIEFRSASPGEPPASLVKLNSPSGLRPCWFYIIHFEEVAMVGSWATCVELLDGSIVEPESAPASTNMWRYLE
jgi:hypothetical protein